MIVSSVDDDRGGLATAGDCDGSAGVDGSWGVASTVEGMAALTAAPLPSLGPPFTEAAEAAAPATAEPGALGIGLGECPIAASLAAAIESFSSDELPDESSSSSASPSDEPSPSSSPSSSLSSDPPCGTKIISYQSANGKNGKRDDQKDKNKIKSGRITIEGKEYEIKSEKEIKNERRCVRRRSTLW